jgi:hypothetical protein
VNKQEFDEQLKDWTERRKVAWRGSMADWMDLVVEAVREDVECRTLLFSAQDLAWAERIVKLEALSS